MVERRNLCFCAWAFGAKVEATEMEIWRRAAFDVCLFAPLPHMYRIRLVREV